MSYYALSAGPARVAAIPAFAPPSSSYPRYQRSDPVGRRYSNSPVPLSRLHIGIDSPGASMCALIHRHTGGDGQPYRPQ